MIFDIYDDNRYYPLIDIENYYRFNEYDNKHYQTINTTICPMGFSRFILKNKEYFDNKDNLKTFISWIDHLRDLGFLLNEIWRNNSDFPMRNDDEEYSSEEARYVEEKIRKEVEIFCSYWNLKINED